METSVQLHRSMSGVSGLTNFTVFFKVRDAVKKAEVKTEEIKTIDDLLHLFFEKFETLKYSTAFVKHKQSDAKKGVVPYSPAKTPTLSELSNEDIKLTINLTPSADLSKVAQQKPLTDIKDLYPNCVVELKMPQLDVFDKKDIGYGYYEFQRQKLAFVMIGLPARGKSYIARKITRYMRWIGVETQLFNVGNYRRERLGAQQSNEFFDPNNANGVRARLHMAIAALDDMLNWLNKDGQVAIYDATNSTRERRNMILKRCTAENVQVVYIESICNDPAIVEKNIRETKLSSPDYLNKDPEDAVNDFRLRIQQYEKEYQALDDTDSHLSYVKLINVGQQIIINNIETYLPSRVIHFLMNLHITPRPIWFTRHGQSEYNVEDRIGGDSSLTPRGEEYAHALGDWVESNLKGEGLTVWTSTLKRAIATAQYINYPKLSLKNLDEIDAGICDGMTYNEIKQYMPEEYAARNANKLKYKYPQGESYIDVMQRLEPVLFELERQKTPVLVVSHQAVLRCLFVYFLDLPVDELPYINVESSTVYQFTPRAYGTDVKKFKLQ